MKRFAILTSTLLLAGNSLLADNAAARVAAMMRHSVVEIHTLDGHGAGLIIDRDGFILTNRHVADSLVILGVKTQPKGGKANEPRVIRRARLLKVHPRMDLALIKMEAANISLTPIRIDSAEKPAIGMECYAVGVPTGEPTLNKLNLSVTQGMVSAANVSLRDGDYIQTTAPINPGNSGGPLCSARGDVLGIVTAKLDGADNIGFAIPLSSVKLNEFRDVELHKAPAGTLEQARGAVENKLAGAAQLNSFDRIDLVQEAIKDYAAIIREHGASVLLMTRLGQLHISITLDQGAATCFRHVLNQDPDNLQAIWYLGATAWNEGRRDDAHGVWQQLLDTDPKGWGAEPNWAALTISGIGSDLLQQGRVPAAAYCLLWARSLWPDVTHNPIHPVDLSKILEEARRDEPAFAKWADKPTPFTLDALRQLSELAPAKDRHDRYATNLIEEGFGGNESQPASTTSYELDLPEGALNIQIKNAKPGMRIDPQRPRIIWENAPDSYPTTQVMILYDVEGKAAYKLITIPARDE